MAEVETFEGVERAPVIKKKRRGRPPKKKVQTTGAPIKATPTGEDLERASGKRGVPPRGTGKRTWRPANMLAVDDKDPNFRTRWVRFDKIELRKQEGWEIIEGKHNPMYEGRHLPDGSPMSSARIKGQLVLMRLPEEMAKQRDEYYKKRTRDATAEGVREAESEMAKRGYKTYTTSSHNV